MKEQNMPSYTELDLLLNKTAPEMHPSQVHGLVCGLIAGDPHAKIEWDAIIGTKVKGKTLALLKQLHEVSVRQLKDFLFEFQLFLPAETEPLPVRAEALTVWCQGVLTGLKMAKVPLSSREPGEVTEAIKDLVEIAQMNYEEVVATEEDEAAYYELLEFVRMAMILIYQELQGDTNLKSASSSSKQLH